MSGSNPKKSLTRGLTSTVNPGRINSLDDLKKNVTNPKQGLKDTVNNVIESQKDTLDPMDVANRDQKAIDKKKEAEAAAAAKTESERIAAMMLPNSPLNTFRPYVNTLGQPPVITGRLPPMSQGQQYDTNMLRQMIQTPQYGQAADQQWQQVRQGLAPTAGVPQMGMPTEQQMAMIALQNRMRMVK